MVNEYLIVRYQLLWSPERFGIIISRPEAFFVRLYTISLTNDVRRLAHFLLSRFGGAPDGLQLRFSAHISDLILSLYSATDQGQ